VVVDTTIVVVVDVVVVGDSVVLGVRSGFVVVGEGPAGEGFVVVGTIAVGVSVTWSRTLPTAAAAMNTAVVVTASQIRA